jgi:cell division initiation protein
MTPLEIHTHRFGHRMRGLDSEEVETFLRMVAEDYESVLHENESYRDRIHRLEEEISRLGAQEQLLKETLMSAQCITEEMRQTAVKESEVLIGEAEVRAEKIIDAAHRRAHQIAESIRELKGLRGGIAEGLRAAIQTHLQLIERLEKETGHEGEALVDGIVDGKVAVLKAAPNGREAPAPGQLSEANARQQS